MCIRALPENVVMGCIDMKMLCPPGKPGVQLILLNKSMNVTFLYSLAYIIMFSRTIHYNSVCFLISIIVCVTIFLCTYILENEL